jgi:hypothetical protein
MAEVELVTNPDLMKIVTKQEKRRPWEVNPENVELVRRLFPMWMDKRHGIVVYECPAMDSSAMGNKTFMPYMFEAEDDQFHPCPLVRSPTGNCSDQEWAQDWVCKGWIHEDFFGLPTDEILDACFYYEVAGGARLHLMSGEPWTD